MKKFNNKGFVKFWVVYDKACETFWEGNGGDFWRETLDNADKVCIREWIVDPVVEAYNLILDELNFRELELDEEGDND